MKEAIDDLSAQADFAQRSQANEVSGRSQKIIDRV
jgi:hypothetical protein